MMKPDREFVCEACRSGAPNWMCQCDNDEAWEAWMMEQELRTLNERELYT